MKFNKDYFVGLKIVKVIVILLLCVVAVSFAFTQMSQKDDMSLIIGIGVLLAMIVIFTPVVMSFGRKVKAVALDDEADSASNKEKEESK